jgi:hypothetical protein
MARMSRAVFFRQVSFRFVLLLTLALPVRSACGQSTAADRARLLQSQSTFTAPARVNASGVDQDYAASSPNDEDLGEQAILRRVEQYQPFILETGVPIYYTSNVALVDRGRVSDVIIAPVVGFTYAPQFNKTLYGEFGVRQQFFYYQDFTSFNFASLDVFAGGAYYLPELNNLALRANIDYNRLTGTDNFDDFFSNVALNLNAEIPFRIGRAQQVSVGASASVSLYAEPDPPRRNDLGVYAGYTVNVSRDFSLSASGSVIVRPYNFGGRTDVSEILALSANYRIRDWFTMSAFSSFVANQSNRSAFDYEVFNTGGGVSFTWRF